VHESVWHHPTSSIIGDVEIGEGSTVWPGAVIRGDFGPIRIGSGTSIQDNVVIHTTTRGTFVGSHCVIGHLAFVEEATIEDGCLVGVGARVLNGVHMRTGSVAAAGAVLVAGIEVPTGMRAQGVPARLVSPREQMREWVLSGAEEYVEMGKRYLNGWQQLLGPEARPTD
jgi:carbonic anhydrase/acetyltransferase-like protein (isoleucine patch superfamily)